MALGKMAYRALASGIVAGCLVTMTSCVSPDTSPDPYLTEASENLNNVELPEPSQEQKQLIQHLTEHIHAAAQKRYEFSVSKETAIAVGRCGITHIAPLLKNEDPWIRGGAMKTLLAMDQREALPFVLGMVCDNGSFNWQNDVVGDTVGSEAIRALQNRIHQNTGTRVPAEQESTSTTRQKAFQAWFAYHAQYYDWHDEPRSVYWHNGLALYAATPTAEIAGLREREPERFKHVLVIQPQDGKRHAVFSRGDKVRLLLAFRNFGSETTSIRWDKRDERVHCLKLIGPNGKELPLRKEAIPALGEGIPLLQPVWKDGNSAIGWEMDLSQAYDLSSRGCYRLYYTYRPPSETDAKEYSKPIEITFWDGRSYVDYYEFRITKEGRPRRKAEDVDESLRGVFANRF